MARPIWKGYITFGLVNIPVILYSAEKKFVIQFKLVDSRDRSRIHYERINEHTGAEVPWEDVAKAYEYEDNNFILLKEEDFKKIAGENSKTINIESFVNKDVLSYMYYEKPYYLVPDKKGEKGYVILRETLKASKKIAIAKVIIHTREYLAAMIPHENALILNLLRYEQELRKPDEFDLPTESLKTYKINSHELEIAKQLVASMTTKWKPADYHDEYRETLQKWIEEKIHKGATKKSKYKTAKKKGTKSNVINFADLLKQSLAAKKGTSKKTVMKKRRRQ